MASFLLLVVFLLFGSFSARAQAGYSPPGARTATGRLKTKVDRLSSLVETLLSQQSDLTARVDSLSAQLSEERDKNRELALNLTQALHKLDSMTSTLYEHDSVIKQRLQDGLLHWAGEAIRAPEGTTCLNTTTPPITALPTSSARILGCACENVVLLKESVFHTFENLHVSYFTTFQCACENPVPVTEGTSPTEPTGPVIEGDCAEYYSSGRTTSGVYRIGLLPGHVEAYCDMDTAVHCSTTFLQLGGTAVPCTDSVSCPGMWRRTVTWTPQVTLQYDVPAARWRSSTMFPQLGGAAVALQYHVPTARWRCTGRKAVPNVTKLLTPSPSPSRGSWTLIQRRQDGSVPFNRTWEEYKHGFGNKSGEYWLGNENIHLLTNQRNYTLRVELEDWDGWILYAEYTSFWLSGESDQYRIHMSGYWGTDRDAMKLNNEQMFSTVDRDNDEDREYDCSRERGQGGWWFASCGYTYLNGRYLGNCGDSCPWLQGIIWGSWKGYFYSLKSGSMKIRPTEEVSTTKPQPSVPPPATETDDPTIEGDCAEYYSSGRTTSGVYRIGLLPGHVEAYCDMDTAEGGWTVIQRRVDGSVPFNRTWEEYKRGFGNKSGEYWLGNENIHLLTNQKDYRLRIDMQDWDNQTRYAEYSTFRVLGEYGDQYRLHVSGYNGTAGDSMTRYFSNDGMRFSTVDRDNDLNSGHCCQRRGQGGWWFGNCGNSFLNGRYLVSCGRSCEVWQGVIWHSFTGSRGSLKSVSMKIRPY
ncbi:hypothetical protein Bbelb_332840 [Branchiostoma belcheri]|nr:hypothetical protein Bbelb_332840 [Branchiostoma belcheri]